MSIGLPKTRLRRRILATFAVVLLVAFALTFVIFNVSMRTLIDNTPGLEIPPGEISRRADAVLIPLISIVFGVTLIATTILSRSITRPIELLDEYALRIGQGGFETSDFGFRDRELADLNDALNRSVRQLGIYDSEQKTFFANASHELRTPLMSIQCQAEGIAHGIMDPAEASQTILDETAKLSDLVTDLLYIAKIDKISTAFERAPVDLGAVLRRSAERLAAVAGSRGVVIEAPKASATVDGVEDLLERAVDNMLGNAIRYASTTVSLSLGVVAGRVTAVILDDGDGFDEGDLPHVFERFYKGRGGNTGVGLSIVKSIAEQHGGWVRAANSPEGGAMLTLVLPRGRG